MNRRSGDDDGFNRRVSVALVNDRPLVVAGLAQMIREHSSDFEVSEIELGGSDVSSVDIALFDLDSGEQIEQRIKNLRNDRDVAHVAIYTWHADEEILRVAADDRSVSVIPKSSSGPNLVAALRDIARQGRSEDYPSRPIGATLPMGAAEAPRLPLDLSARERDVAIGAASGLTNRALAERTGLSENTIKTYLSRAMQKTGSRNRAALAAWAAHHGLVRFD